MANYREIVTKAVVSKGKKLFSSTNSVTVNNPSTILGCWVINHNFSGKKVNNDIISKLSWKYNYEYSEDSLNRLLKTTVNDELKKAYYLKEEYREFNLCADNPEDAAEKLEDLILKFKRSGISEYIPFWKLLENWKNEIINSFTRINGVRISNGPIEKANAEIRKLIKVSYGCSNFTRFKNRIMYVINGNEPILGTRKKQTNKRKFKPRGKYKK